MAFTAKNYFTDLNVPVYADSLDMAEYMAYKTYGLDAIGVNIVNDDNGDFKCTVAYKVWDEVLNRYFPSFTMDDVLNHLMVTSYAWLNFEHIVTHGYDRDGEYTSERLCDEGFAYIHEHDALSVAMDAIGFTF
jgi:hypothetical protein